MKIGIIVGSILAAISLIFFFQFTIFVVQPIGAVPEGRTMIISRLTNINFIDSADAICQRQMGGVNLLCRSAVLGKIVSTATIYVRLPYSSMLYGISTGGVTYDR